MQIVVQLLSIAFGVTLVAYTLISAVRSFVLPRGENVPLTRWIFSIIGFLFALRRRKANTYEERDQIMALFAPLTLLIIPVVWVILVMIGYAFIFWGIGVQPWDRALEMSGSSLLTLGTVPFENLHTTLIEFSEATIGLGLVALLIAYLPTMYSAFSRREALVTMLEVRAGSPPSAVELVIRMHRIGGLKDDEALTELWKQWEIWFTELEESHTSLAPVIFFRSPNPQRSWVTAAGTIMDSAALFASSVDIPNNPSAQLMIRAGYIALQSIGRFFRIDFDPDPQPSDPISITQDEFNEVYDQLEAEGVPMKPDREQAWRDFAGWRVNYDYVLLRLATLTMAPYAPWISDRSIPTSLRD